MIPSIRRWWSYATTVLGHRLDAATDPAVLIDQAIAEARDQHRRLTEQAAEVIADQRALEARLDRAIEARNAADASVAQALLMADAARRSGRDDEAGRLEEAADAFATRTVMLDEQIGLLRVAVERAAGGSARARDAVAHETIALRRHLAERDVLLGRLDQARLQERMHEAMSRLDTTMTGSGPSLDDVRERIDRRLGAADAHAEISGSAASATMLAVEASRQRHAVIARLSDVRATLGLPPGPSDALAAGPATGSPVHVRVVEPASIGPGEDA